MSQTPIPMIDLEALHRPIRAELDAAMARVLDGGRFVGGAEVEAFEAAFAQHCESPHAVGCASGSDALLLALMALGIESGDEVRLYRDDVSVATGGTTSAEVFGVAHVTEDVPPGVMCGYFNFRGDTRHTINALTDADLDPINNLYTFKISRANVSPTGRKSEFASRMSFVPRAIFGAG